jgi:riboflavin kinase / FMN adenylyltransferase
VPADGVYAGVLRVLGSDSDLPAAISVGTNPQFDGRERRVEAFVLDRDDLDLYGSEVGVSFAERIRGQQTFASVDALVQRMAVDVEEARRLLAGT